MSTSFHTRPITAVLQSRSIAFLQPQVVAVLWFVPQSKLGHQINSHLTYVIRTPRGEPPIITPAVSSRRPLCGRATSSGRAYVQAQESIYRVTACDLSVYRLQLDRRWYLAVLGLPPPPYLDQQLKRILAAGESVALPPEVVRRLLEQRARAIQTAPWVEGHHRPSQSL